MNGKFVQMVRRIRFRDSIIFQTPALVSLILFSPVITGPGLLRILVLAAGSFLLMAFIFSFNDWADIKVDSRNPLKEKHTFVRGGISEMEMLAFSMLLAGTGTLLVGLVSISLGVVALLIVLLGLAYSFPLEGFSGKTIPVISSLMHFAVTQLIFLLGSASVSPFSARALLLAAFFGLIITAGHLVQEVKDYDEDHLARLRTNAVWLGKKAAFLLAFTLFSGSFAFLYWLAQAGYLPGIVRYTVILYPVYFGLALGAYRNGLDHDSVQRLRDRYRVLFAVIVLVIVGAVLIQRFAGWF